MRKINYGNENTIFNSQICKIFTEIIMKDQLNVQVLFYIAQCEKLKTSITMQNIANNVKAFRRIAIKDSKKKIVSFSKEEGTIGRKKAEKIVERLAYASLITFETHHPYKYIKLSPRGVQVAVSLKQMEETEHE